MKSLEQRALAFARKAHESIGQVRKYTNEPYINHPIAVADIVRSVPHTEDMIAAALLHDVVEDTNFTLDEVRLEFGDEVAVLVEMLTDVSCPQDGNRAKRKMLDLMHTALASPEAKTIKLADIIDNASSVTQHDKSFAILYLTEKLMSLEVLREGDASLWFKARSIIRKNLIQDKLSA